MTAGDEEEKRKLQVRQETGRLGRRVWKVERRLLHWLFVHEYNKKYTNH